MSLIGRAKLSFSALLVTTLLGLSLSGAAIAAGTIPLAMAVQFDTDGNVASGCQLTLYQAGTVATKQNVYSDFGLTQLMSNPLTCDQAGRVPMFWLADGLIHARLITSSGTQILDVTMQVLGPSSGGGGGGGTVDPAAILQTGDQKVRYGTGPLAGFVRLNGLTIGNAASGASERANADTQALFVYLCGTDLNLVMTPPRSGNCLNDYNANKVLAVPDMRGRLNGFLADMGNSATAVLTAAYAGCTVTTLGASCGSQNHLLTLGELPTGITSANASQSITVNVGGGNIVPVTPSGAFLNDSVNGAATTVYFPRSILAGWSAQSSFTGSNSINVTSNNTSGQSHAIVPPIMLFTAYMKL